MRSTPLVFLFFFLIMLTSAGGHLDTFDGKGYFLLTQNIARYGSLILQPDLIPPPDHTEGQNGGGQFTLRMYFSWLMSLRPEQNNLTVLCSKDCIPPDEPLKPTPSIGSPLFALIGVPFYLIADNILNYPTAEFTSFFVNPLIIALMCTVIYILGSLFYRSKKIGFILGLVAAVASFVWPYVSSYYQQPLAALISITCLYFLFISSRSQEIKVVEDSTARTTTPTTTTTATLLLNARSAESPKPGHEKRFLLPKTLGRSNNIIISAAPLLGGIFLGLQSFGHSGTVLIVPGIAIVGIYLFRKDKKKLFQFLLGFTAFVVLQGVINYSTFGSVTDFGYGWAQSQALHIDSQNISLEGLPGLLLSPGTGLIIYFPLIALLPLGVYLTWKRNRIFCIAFLYVFVAIWYTYGTLPGVFYQGSGGGWGPRYMITAVPALVMLIGSVLSLQSFDLEYLKRKSAHITGRMANIFVKTFKGLFILLAFAGFVVNLLGVLVWAQLGFSYGYGHLQVNQLPDHLYKYFTWYPEYNPVRLHLEVLTTDWWHIIRDTYPLYFGWEPCLPDNYIYCNFGLIPSVGMLISTLLLGLAVTRVVSRDRPPTYSVDADAVKSKK